MSLHHSQGTLTLGNPEVLKGLLANLLNFCPGERHWLYYPGQETNLLSVLEEDILSSETVCYTHIL